MPTPEPFQIGQYVEFFSPASRVDPFRADEVMEVQSLSRIGRGKATRWRVRVFSVNRAVSGWLDATALQTYGGEPW